MQNLEEVLREKLIGIERTNGDKVSREQNHLHEGTDERAYWHHGYASALRDTLRVLESARGPVN
jgi:predicted phage gp36 major capsid-like protein